uniref:Uncharacterized protein n=1 Tax=Panagrolaimus sp. JU765 TaxID=591449 RepID=A0AC34R850_9BILA
MAKESAIFPTNGDVDEEGFIPKLAIPQAIAVLDDDDLDYMDRVNRLQHALKVKRSVVSEADGYSQNIRPIDLDGMKLVRAPIIELLDEEDYFEPIPRRVSRMDAPAPFSYFVVN